MLTINLTQKVNMHGISSPLQQTYLCSMLTLSWENIFPQTETTSCSPGTDLEGKYQFRTKNVKLSMWKALQHAWKLKDWWAMCRKGDTWVCSWNMVGWRFWESSFMWKLKVFRRNKDVSYITKNFQFCLESPISMVPHYFVQFPTCGQTQS